MNTDLARRLENLIRMGTIDTVDHAAKRCTVKTGKIITAPLPWLTMRAGTDKTWDPPTAGEQCCIFSPSGELATGFVVYGFYSDANPAPSDDPDLKIREYSDGAVAVVGHLANECRFIAACVGIQQGLC
jgi:phage baseplate assembly protein V